jgi:hypothetical protein
MDSRSNGSGEQHGEYKTATDGWVYCIVNFRDRERVKIGMTTRPMENRMKEANGTFTVDGFYIAIAKFVRNPYEKEQAMHMILSEHRVSARREFFDVQTPGVFDKIVRLFDLMDGEVHAESKLRLDYNMRRARVSTPPEENHAPAKRTRAMSSFRDAFWKSFESADLSRFVLVSDVVAEMEKQGFTDVSVDMQNIGLFPYENARRQMVYRAIQRKTIDLSSFKYTEED